MTNFDGWTKYQKACYEVVVKLLPPEYEPVAREMIGEEYAMAYEMTQHMKAVLAKHGI